MLRAESWRPRSKCSCVFESQTTWAALEWKCAAKIENDCYNFQAIRPQTFTIAAFVCLCVCFCMCLFGVGGACRSNRKPLVNPQTWPTSCIQTIKIFQNCTITTGLPSRSQIKPNSVTSRVITTNSSTTTHCSGRRGAATGILYPSTLQHVGLVLVSYLQWATIGPASGGLRNLTWRINPSSPVA